MIKQAKVGLLVAFLILLISVSSCTNPVATTQSAATSIDELQKEKLSLEIEQLKVEQRFVILNRWTGIIAGLFGLMAILWTIFQGYRTLAFQTESQRSDRIAALLSQIGAPKKEVRIGAARGLTRYADEVIDEALSAISIEQSPRIRNALEELLMHTSDKNIDKIFSANTETFPRRAYLIGRLGKAGATPEFSEVLFRLSRFARMMIRKEYRFFFDQGRNFQAYQIQRNETLVKNEADENYQLIELCTQISNLTSSTSRVIARLLRDHRRPRKIKTPLDLTLSNLYKTDLSKLDLSGSLMYRCIMRHVDLSESILIRCDLSESNLYGSSFNFSDISGACLRETDLRSSHGKETKFSEASMRGAILSEGSFNHADFSSADLVKAKFRGTDLSGANLAKCRLNQAEFHQAVLVNAVLSDTKCFGSIFIEANFTNANLEGAKLGGADLRGAIFTDANLRNVDLSGANIGQADFRGANIEGIITHKARGKESALFDEKRSV